MKKTLLLLTLTILISCHITSAQKYNKYSKARNLPLLEFKPVHWGFTTGINKTDFTIIKNETILKSDTAKTLGIETTSIPGLYLGPIFSIRLGKYFNLRLLFIISFTQRNLTYYQNETIENKKTIEKITIKQPSSYLELPILLKYKGARMNNLRPYIVLGAAAKYDIAALRKTNTDKPHIKLTPFDTYLEIGPGFDFYLPYFKLSIELKYSNGFLNILQKENTIYTNPIDKIKSNSFMLSFHFEG